MDIKNRIRVYVPNLSVRHDRRQSIMEQFKGKIDFDIKILTPVDETPGYVSLWKTFYLVVQEENKRQSPYFVFCEDDHIFTKEYKIQFLKKCIAEADLLLADILSGGMSWVKDPLQVTDSLFWVNKFNGMQFTVVFSRFYNRVLMTKNEGFDHVTDVYLSDLSSSIFVMYPYISVQREFGYSDVTMSNSRTGHVDALFNNTENRLRILNKVKRFYDNLL